MIDAAYLQKCCSAYDDLRWYLRKPWSRGEWTYATNGHIMIRVPRLPDVAENDKSPDAEKLLAKIPPATEWLSVPALAPLPKIDCPECDGNGTRECSMGYKHPCEECDGTGKVEELIRVTVGNACFKFGYFFT